MIKIKEYKIDAEEQVPKQATEDNNMLRSYIVLFDPTFDQVVNFLDVFDKTFIFIFLTGSLETQLNWNEFPKKTNFVIAPYYIGDFPKEKVHSFVQEIVSRDMSKLIPQLLRIEESLLRFQEEIRLDTWYK